MTVVVLKHHTTSKGSLLAMGFLARDPSVSKSDHLGVTVEVLSTNRQRKREIQSP